MTLIMDSARLFVVRVGRWACRDFLLDVSYFCGCTRFSFSLSFRIMEATWMNDALRAADPSRWCRAAEKNEFRGCTD